MELPMLNELEFEKAGLIYKQAITNISTTREERFKPLLDYYQSVTGFSETEPNAIMHHRISIYGPPCENCGKPYRTPLASFCASCGHKHAA
jgi:hypothetical protein